MNTRKIKLLYVLIASALLVGVGLSADESEACWTWELELDSTGVMKMVLPCSFAEDAAHSLLLAVANRGFNGEGFDGIEIVAESNRTVSVDMKVTCKDESIPPDMNQWHNKETILTKPLVIGTTARASRLPFSQLRVPEEVLSQHPSVSPEIIPAEIVCIELLPRTLNVDLVIHSLSFYRVGADRGVEERAAFDQFSIASSREKGWWFGVPTTATSSEDWVNLETVASPTDYPWAWPIRNQGGTLDAIQDPTGSDRGIIMRVTIPPRIEDGFEVADSGPIEEQWPSILVSRVYAACHFPFREAPCDTSVDVWASREFVETAVGTYSGAVLLDVYSKTSGSPGWYSPYGPKVNSAVQAKLWVFSVIDGKTYLSLSSGQPTEPGGPPLVEGAPEFTPETWHTIRILIDKNRRVYLYQDGQLVRSCTLDRHRSPGTTGGHPGIYIHDSVMRGPYAIGGVVLIDNYAIQCGDCVQVP